MSLRHQETHSISLPIGKDTSGSSIRYTKYCKGDEGECWFCGQQTMDYRAFAYNKSRYKPGIRYSTHIESTIVLKIWCCKSCNQQIDLQKESLDAYGWKIGLIGYVVGTIIGLFFNFYYDTFSIAGNIFFSVFGAGTAGLVIGNFLGKEIRKSKYSEIEKKILHRLNQHPEVKAVKSEQYSRYYG